MATAASPTRTCGEAGCGRPLRARGLCSTHYNQQHQPNRHAKVTVPCGWCRKTTLKHAAQRYAARFCSLACRDAWRKATGINPAPPPGLGCGKPWSRKTRARAKLRKAARGTVGRRWVAGTCPRCGCSFIAMLTNDAGRYCSDQCKNRTKGSRRRARKRGARHEPYSRPAIFERDRWRCHICKRRTLRTKAVPHPRAPVIDHLVPLAAGGDDTAANVATACFLCNSTKREHGGGEQLALIG